MKESKSYLDIEGIKSRLNDLGFKKVCEAVNSSFVKEIKGQSLLIYRNCKPSEYIICKGIERHCFKTVNELNQIYEKLYTDITK